MTPQAYLLYSIQHKCYRRRDWVINAFALTRESEAQKKVRYPGKLVREPYGLFVVLEDESLEKIEPSDVNQPLFRKEDRITITPEWIGSLKEPKLETSVGTLLINLICLYEAFGSKYPYQAGKISVGKLENDIAKVLKSVPPEGQARDSSAIYVDERLKFVVGVGFLETFASVFAHSVTRAGLTPPPGRKEFKQELLKKYEGRLTDPVEMTKFEKELEAFDAAYLKENDPSYGKFMKGKKTMAFRQRAFLTQGGEVNGFTGDLKVTPVIQSLDEGISLEPEAFVAAANTIRYGSFSRGAETVNGGVVSKGVQRASDNWRITKGDCGTSFGIRRLYAADEIHNLVGRYLLVQSKPVLIENEEQAQPYVNRTIIVRSPQFCSRPGHQTCEVCAGLAISQFPNGVPIPLMEVSGGVLTDSLKLMHNTALTTATVDLRSAIS